MEETILGKKYKDSLTGITDTATARITYLFDAPSVQLTLETDKDGKYQNPEWIEEGRLQAV